MKLRLTTSSKLMGVGIALSLGWFLLESCDCDDTSVSKQDSFPGKWVTCVGNKPTLMYFLNDTPTMYNSADFDPSQYDCSTPNSPPRPNPQAAYPVGSQTSPNGLARSHAVG